ncbi:MAG TPA: LppP/LprE family lipoprotein [Solirubrobacteraceae bacterium]
MRRRVALTACALALGTLGGGLLGGCGGGTKTVTVAAAPSGTGARSTSSSGPAHTTSTASAATSPASTTTSPGTAAQSPSTTRTAPAPAFVQPSTTGAPEAAGAETAAAVAVVKTHGYTPSDTSEYHPNQTLRVLIGTRTGSADGYDQRAFFFLGGKYIGTDASQPSASVRVVSQGDTEVVLAYPLYRPHDPLCCPGGGRSTVHFQLNDGQLVPLQPIPSASSTAALSRQ